MFKMFKKDVFNAFPKDIFCYLQSESHKLFCSFKILFVCFNFLKENCVFINKGC